MSVKEEENSLEKKNSNNANAQDIKENDQLLENEKTKQYFIEETR